MDTNVLHNISYGMYIVSAARGAQFNGQIANSAMQITSQPPTIAISINKANLTHEYISASGRFSLSILAEDTPLSFIGRFGFKSGRSEDKFNGVRYLVRDSGCPVVLEHALGWVEAAVVKQLDCMTHTVFLGEIVDSGMLEPARPMTYAYYHQVKRGTTPVQAPTYIKAEEKAVVPGMKKYRCSVCNYIYDPQAGDPDSGIVPGTAFEDIPDSWRCPVCGVEKSKFVAVE